MIEFLRAKRQLENVDHIFSVSGGSITAAHLALNWAQYTGSDEDFLKAKSELVAFGQNDLRGRIVRRWLLSLPLSWFPGPFASRNRSRLLQIEYDRFLNGAALRDLRKIQKSPVVHMLATSMTTGKLCSFDATGFTTIEEGSASQHDASLIPAAFAVAASSAFPPMFPPLRLDRKELDLSAEDFPTEIDFLTDGGVFDNLGIRKAMGNYVLETRPDLLLISDASGGFEWDVDSDFRQIIDRTVRTTDILMKRVADLDIEALTSKSEEIGLDFRVIGIASEFAQEPGSLALPSELSRAVARIRTDLDTFSELEIKTLIQHGYCAAQNWTKDAFVGVNGANTEALADQEGLIDYAAVPTNSAQRALAQLKLGRKRRFGVFNWKDAATLPLVAVPLIVLGITVQFFFSANQALETASQVSSENDVLIGEKAKLQTAYSGLTEARSVFVATNRVYDAQKQAFTDEPAKLTRYFRVTVGIPPAADTIALENSTFRAPRVSVADTVLERDVGSTVDSTTFFSSLQTNTLNGNSVLVFVHDWNTRLDQALRLAAATASEINYPGQVILFSWPSRGIVTAYDLDRSNMKLSIDFLTSTFSELAVTTNLNVDVVTTGMGSDLVLRALSASSKETRANLRNVAMFWPHFDRNSAADFAKLVTPDGTLLTIYTTRSDEIRLLGLLNSGNTPVGSSQNSDVPGVDIVNLYGQDWPAEDVALVLQGVPPSKRPGILPVANTRNTWALGYQSGEAED